MEVLSEVAAVAQGGLQINEPGKSRSLKTLPGTWSDLALARSGCAPLQPQPPGLHACHFFRHHPCPNGNLLLACYLHQGLIAHGEHLAHRCSGWTQGQAIQLRQGWWSSCSNTCSTDFTAEP
jgi:hypothetical protein